MNVSTATTKELLEIVGSGRGMHSSESVAAAEAELSRRSAGEEERLLRRVRRAGTICAVVGGFFMLWGLAMAAFGLSILEPPEAGTFNEPFFFRHFSLIYEAGASLEAFAGGFLFWGGLDLRKLKSRGGLLIVAVLWFGFASIAVFTIVWVASLPWRESVDSPAVMMLVAGFVSAAFWSFLLWLPYRFFTSSRVREACRELGTGTPNQAAGAGR